MSSLVINLPLSHFLLGLSLISPLAHRVPLSYLGFMALALVPLLPLGTLETSQKRDGLNLQTT